MAYNPKLPITTVGPHGGAKYSDAVRRRILAALKLGGTRTAAAESSGIHRDTFFDWIKDPEFEAQVRTAEAAAELFYTRLLRGHSQRDPGSVRFWLERRRPAVWREKLSLLSADPTLEDTIEEAMNDDELRERLSSLASEALERGTPPAASGNTGGDAPKGSED